ncbi:MAG: hypothetical protein R3199_07405 [Gemmatimonadota bacterium]|nr:hypothetical protein [Gemmatimonadota bacterium]
MTPRGIVAAATALLVAAGCTARIGGDGVANVPGEEIWKRQVELAQGELALIDEEGLELRLDDLALDQVELTVRTDVDAEPRTIFLRPGGEEFLSPYTIRLLELWPDRARFEVRKEWGR